MDSKDARDIRIFLDKLWKKLEGVERAVDASGNEEMEELTGDVRARFNDLFFVINEGIEKLSKLSSDEKKPEKKEAVLDPAEQAIRESKRLYPRKTN